MENFVDEEKANSDKSESKPVSLSISVSFLFYFTMNVFCNYVDFATSVIYKYVINFI